MKTAIQLVSTKRSHSLQALFLLAAICLPVRPCFSQEAPATFSPPCLPQTDALDVLGFHPPEPASSQAMRRGNIIFVPGPYLGVNPTSGTILGLGTNALFRLGDSPTLLSTIDNLAAYSSNRQFIFFSKSTVLTENNEWELAGDWRYYRFSQPLGELGTNTQSAMDQGISQAGDLIEVLSGEQPIMFDYLRFRETAFKRLANNFYAGLGYSLDNHLHVEDTAFDPAGKGQAITTHAAYSFCHGFDPTHYVTSGVSANFLVEARDHVLNAYQGEYMLLAYTINPTVLGSSQDSQVVYGEYRKYFPLSETQPRQIIGFWAMANWVVQGSLPYLDLPAGGYDTRERSGRGSPQGRWRGDKLAYAEAEYRFPLLDNGLLGGVVFANAITASRPAVNHPALGIQAPEVKWFECVKPAVGAGIRLMVVKEIRMNIECDVARGVDGPEEIYLNIFEAF